jgi:hypothetical protein
MAEVWRSFELGVEPLLELASRASPHWGCEELARPELALPELALLETG